MTSPVPAPPPGIPVRQPMTLDQIAAAAASLIAAARAAGLTPPCALSCQDYGPPAATLYINEDDAPDIWQALRRWASRYQTEIAIRPTGRPESVYASAEFRSDGIRYEVYSIIRTPDGDSQPGPRSQAA